MDSHDSARNAGPVLRIIWWTAAVAFGLTAIVGLAGTELVGAPGGAAVVEAQGQCIPGVAQQFCTATPTAPLQPPTARPTNTLALPSATPTPTPARATDTPTLGPTPTRTPTPAVTLTPGTVAATVTPTAGPTCPTLTLDPSALSTSPTFMVSGVNTGGSPGTVDIRGPAGWPVTSSSGQLGAGAGFAISYTVPSSVTVGTHPIRAYLRPAPPTHTDPVSFTPLCVGCPQPGDPSHVIYTPLTKFGSRPSASSLNQVDVGLLSDSEDDELLAEDDGALAIAGNGIQPRSVSGIQRTQPLVLNPDLLVPPGILIGCGDLSVPQLSATIEGRVVEGRTTVGVADATIELIAAPPDLKSSKGPKSGLEYLNLDLLISSLDLSLPSCLAGQAGGFTLSDFASAILASSASDALDLPSTGSRLPHLVMPSDYDPPGTLRTQQFQVPAELAGKLSPPGSPGAFRVARAGVAGLVVLGNIGHFSETVDAPGSYYLRVSKPGYIPYVGEIKYAVKPFQTINVGNVPLVPYTSASAPVKSCAPSPYFLSFPANQVPVNVHYVAGAPPNSELAVIAMDFSIQGGPVVAGYPLEGGGWGVDMNVSPRPPGFYCVSARPTFAGGIEGDFNLDPSSCPTSFLLLDTPGWVDAGWVDHSNLGWDAGAWQYNFTYTVPGDAFDYSYDFGPYSVPVVNIEIIPAYHNRLGAGVNLVESFRPTQYYGSHHGWNGSGSALLALTLMNRNLLDDLNLGEGSGNPPIVAHYSAPGGGPLPANEPWYSWNWSSPDLDIVPNFHLIPKTPIWDIWVVAVYIQVDFGVTADLTMNGSITPRVGGTGQFTATFTPAAQLNVEVSMPIELLLDVADVTPHVDIEAGVGIPVTWRDEPGALSVGSCFFVSAELRVHVYVWKVMDDDFNIAGPYRYDTPDGCRYAGGFPVYASDDENEGPLQVASTSAAQPAPSTPRYSAPALAADASGNALVLYPDYGARPGRVLSPQVLYRNVSGGTATTPDFAATQGSFDPAVAFIGPNRALAAWTVIPSGDEMESNRLQVSAALANSQFDEVNRLLRDAVNRQDIAYSVWDGARWSPSLKLTEDNRPDGTPTLAADPENGRALLAWVKDSSTDAVARNGQRLSIYAAEWNGSSWSAPSELYASGGQNYAPTVAFRNGRGTLVWVEDQDGDLNTTSDARLMMATYANGQWGSPAPVPNTPGGASSPNVALDATGNPLIAFTALDPGTHTSATGAVYTAYVRGGQADVARIGAGGPGESPRIVITPEGEALVFYRPLDEPGVVLPPRRGSAVGVSRRAPSISRGLTAPDPQHPTTSIAATSAMLSSSPLTWADPRVVASQPAANWTSLAATQAGRDAILLSFADAFATQLSLDVAPSDRVQTLRLGYQPNPVAKAITFSDPRPAAGQRVTVDATITNLGLAPLTTGGEAAFYLDDPGNPAALIGRAPLAPASFGQEQHASVSFTSDGRQHLVFVTGSLGEGSRASGRYDVVAAINGLPVPSRLRAGGNPVGPGALLNWNVGDSSEAMTFAILRSDSQDGTYAPVGVANVPAFIDETAAPGVTYYYKVASENAGGQRSGLSNVAAVTPGDIDLRL